MRLSSLALVYFAALLAGLGIMVWQQNSAVKLVAARKLLINDPVTRGDLSLEPNGRQFLTRGVEAGKTISLGEIASTPVDLPAGPKVPVAVAVSPTDLVADVRPNASLRICGDNIPATVRVVHCNEDITTCLAIVDVLASDRDKLKPDAERILKSSCEASQ